ncbi:tumor protein p53-inducible nuclear protein 1 isoform X2 [Ursus arctos]|uniref:tumor protein p53-inducible nuclear protein 1 isoform X2 n=1 Tax=Ursus arctos TaxID=9644 RepID=UPI002016F3CA|nr:tumor protein p53-inducible nuclear protein 1 isoform X2 [Ursus arctos]
MFQRLNKMFVGEVNTSSNQEPEFSEKEDDEWILVDFIGACAGFSAAEAKAEAISEESRAEHPSVFSCLPASLECLADTSDSCLLQFESCPMEESWFITPPPCFTAGGLTTLKVETSPMENLLIEHPSMSVYAVHNSCPVVGEASCGADECADPSSPRESARAGRGRGRRRESLKQAPRSAQSQTRGSISQPRDHDLSRNQESDAQPTEPPRRPKRPGKAAYKTHGHRSGNSR